RESLVQGLTERGWRVRFCKGEVDVCIARIAHQSLDKIVIASSDSGHLLHGAKTFIRKYPPSSSFLIFNVEEIQELLEVNQEQWTVAGAVINNDCVKQVRDQTFAKAWI